MVQGTVKILLRITEGDEFGVYRITESEQRYLLLAFDRREEAIECGKMIASFLHVNLVNHLPVEVLGKGFSNVTEEEVPKTKVKIKKVMGISKYCIKLLYENKSTEEILKAIAQKYLEAGRGEAYAKESAEWVLREARKEIS